jgi:hypothetical protein
MRAKAVAWLERRSSVLLQVRLIAPFHALKSTQAIRTALRLPYAFRGSQA